jgi:hypothetical protein
VSYRYTQLDSLHLKFITVIHGGKAKLTLITKSLGMSTILISSFRIDMHDALGYNLGSDFLYWKNEHMTFSIAAIKAEEYNLKIQNCKHTHIPNQTMWAMLNYSSCSFDQLKDIKLLDVDWAQLNREKIKTVVTYKQFIYKSLTTPSK